LKSRAELESLTDSLMQAWNAHDAVALCALYAADADFMGGADTMIQGRDAIFAHYRELFATNFAQSSLAINALKVRMLTARTAVLHAVWSMRGHSFHSGEWLPVHTGTLLVVCKRNSTKWEFVFVHCTGASAAARAS
jgi:uncharacterized protein (TIGR02246 family)